MRLRTLFFALCLCLPALAQPAGPNAQLQQLTKQARVLAAAGKSEDAILLLQRKLATLAAKKAGPAALADALELLGKLAVDRAQPSADPSEARRLYYVGGALFGRALALRETMPPGQDAAIGRLYYEMQEAASHLNALPEPEKAAVEPAAGKESIGIGTIGSGRTGAPPKVEINLAADASGGATFCVLRCDPGAPADSSAMDPADVRRYNAALQRLKREREIHGGLDQDSGKQMVRTRKKREVLAAAYASSNGKEPFTGNRSNNLVMTMPACDAAGCHQDSFSDVAASKPLPSGAAEAQARAEEERLRAEQRRAAMEQLRAQERQEAERQGESEMGAHAPPTPAAQAKPPGADDGKVTYSKSQTYDFKDDKIEGDLAKPTAADLASIERFPTLEAPDRVDAGVEFAVQVSLTTEQVTPEAKITGGKQTAEGKLAMQLPAKEEQWSIDVVLSTTGLDVVGGNNVGQIVLPRSGDSTVAMFRLRARPQAGSGRVMATLWHAGAYLGKITRMVTVGNAAGANAASAASERRATAAPAAKTAQSVAAPAAEAADVAAPAPKPQRATAAIDMTHQAADLTVYIVQVSPDSSDVLIDSPYLQPSHYRVPRNPALGPWLRTEYAEMVRRGNVGNNQLARTEAAAFLHGFGRQAYEQFAPAPFKQAFWKLADKLGPKFHSIQIFTDDPALPWELMRPVRDDGTGERDFLGVEFAVARWHVTEDTRQYDSPPQVEAVRSIVVIAPKYEGEAALAAQSGEVGAMSKMSGYESLPGSLDSVRGLLRELPQGIVHFAGHGRAQRKEAGVQYAIQLEDGILDLMTWRGLVEAGQPNHPVFFMNACEVGGANQVGNFVDGWAPEVLRTGASGYIGALWAVDDSVAGEFARRFYGEYEKELRAGAGVDVGALLARTRRDVFAKTGSPTALAYVFYGDANLRLVSK
jgi:hypothetical protein